jgi:hypothetical protein
MRLPRVPVQLPGHMMQVALLGILGALSAGTRDSGSQGCLVVLWQCHPSRPMWQNCWGSWGSPSFCHIPLMSTTFANGSRSAYCTSRAAAGLARESPADRSALLVNVE